MRNAAALVVLALVLTACSNSEAELTELAKDTCAELEGAIVLEVGPILSRAISDAEDLDFTGPDLGDKMREECPDLMAAVDEIGNEQEREDELPKKVDLVLDGCTSEGANGTVKNNNDVTVSVFIDVQFTLSDGTLVETGIGSVDGLRPGQTGRWEAGFFGSSYKSCEAEIGNVYED